MSNESSPSGQPQGDERRRHPRINIQNEFEKAEALRGAEILFEGHDKPLRVYDMSLSGLACEVLASLQRRQQLVGRIVLGGGEPQSLELTVVWASEKVMGLRFEKCEAAVKLSIGDFLQDRIVGQHMIAVDPKYFAEHVNFQSWYHGPNNTNVFVWKEAGSDAALKIMVAFDGQSLVFEQGELRTGGDRVDWQEEAKYPVEDLPGGRPPGEELPLVLDKEAPLVKRSIEVLSQIPFEQKMFEAVIQNMEAV